jgi:hypothetical protein
MAQAPPEHAARLLRELLAIELLLCGRNGEQPAAAEYQARFPEHAASIAAAFSARSWPRPGTTSG